MCRACGKDRQALPRSDLAVAILQKECGYLEGLLALFLVCTPVISVERKGFSTRWPEEHSLPHLYLGDPLALWPDVHSTADVCELPWSQE